MIFMHPKLKTSHIEVSVLYKYRVFTLVRDCMSLPQIVVYYRYLPCLHV